MTANFAREDLIATAHRMADAARGETLRYFRTDHLQTENKLAEGFDPVTVADRAAEQAMRAVLADMRPHDAILGEEFGTATGTTGLTWVLDPIDGTRAYMSGTPTWGVLIAVGDDTGPQFGIIDQPWTQERFIGGFGVAEVQSNHGTFPLKTRATRDLAEATIFTTFPEVGDEVERTAFHTLADQTRLTRYGMDCYAYALLALGQIDLVVEAGLRAYDIQAPIAVIEAAGGIVTDWTGGPAHNGGRAIAAANPDIHAAALKVLQQTIG